MVLTDKFMTLSKQSVEPGQGLTRLPWDERARPRHGHRRRSRSICADDGSTDAMADRMRRTFGYQGWKANFRNENIYEPFITLKQLYQNLSEDVPLSIEISKSCLDLLVHTYLTVQNTPCFLNLATFSSIPSPLSSTWSLTSSST